MAIDMQARRDAFTFLTDEKAPNEPKQWLVVYTGDDNWAEWSSWDTRELAESRAEALMQCGFTDAQFYDLDNQ